jgi:peptide/nickel transport system substrate-binding protein
MQITSEADRAGKRSNPSDPTDFVGDLALEVPAPTDGGKTYAFTLRRNATFWDGQPVTAHDVVATFHKIISPPEGVHSARKAFSLNLSGFVTP